MIYRARLHPIEFFILDGCSCSSSLLSSAAQLKCKKKLAKHRLQWLFSVKTVFHTPKLSNLCWTTRGELISVFSWIKLYLRDIWSDGMHLDYCMRQFILFSQIITPFEIYLQGLAWHHDTVEYDTRKHCELSKHVLTIWDAIFLYTVFFQVPASIVTS